MTMRERIARGQAEFDGRGWLNMHSADRKRYLQRADLFLAAMREPTPQMLIDAGLMDGYGGEDSYNPDADVDHITWWQAMIDAASEGKT